MSMVIRTKWRNYVTESVHEAQIETMYSWAHLPRLIIKIRLRLQENFILIIRKIYLTKEFDALWFETAGVDPKC